MNPALAPLQAALDRAADRGRRIEVWLRDDDCVAPTPALDRLAALCDAAGLPVLLAVIPEPAVPELAGWIGDHSGFAPCQHGVSHADHAPPGERAIELGGTRPLHALLDDLARGRAKLRALFGPRLVDILVPPWNRIAPGLVSHLGDFGFTALSTIAPSRPATALPRLDCDLDIMDWRRGRTGRPLAELADRAAGLVARQDRVGLLTHHLAHDATAWAALADLLAQFGRHRAVAFADARDLVARAAESRP